MKKNILIIFVVVASVFASCAKKPNTEKEFIVAGTNNVDKEKIEQTAMGVKGCVGAEWNIGSKVLRVRYDSNYTNLGSIKQALTEKGYQSN
ncbi:MAG: cation transporter [Bacteroidota bacterium]|nr:cation transporter [Bacteroidota bacterium]